MYFYLYDSYLANRKYQKILTQIEAKITSLGISGKTARLTIIKDAAELARDAIKKGAKTVVVVGNDRTVNQVISALADTQLPLGIIPVGPNNEIAKILGIPRDEFAPDVLSGRLLEVIDLGMVNDQYFLSHIKIPGNKVDINCNGQYQIIPTSGVRQIDICNLIYPKIEMPGICNPKDGFLEIVISGGPARLISFFKRKKLKGNSLFFVKKVKITSKEAQTVTIDNHKVIKTPLNIEVAPKKLKIIIGKGRLF